MSIGTTIDGWAQRKWFPWIAGAVIGFVICMFVWNPYHPRVVFDQPAPVKGK